MARRSRAATLRRWAPFLESYRRGRKGWRVSLATCAGRLHEAKGVPCQDKVASFKAGRVVSIALADGAGSACFSHLGADLAVKAAARLVACSFSWLAVEASEQEASAWLVKSLQGELQRLSDTLCLEGQVCTPSDLASTLLVVAADESGYVSFHLGDGVIGLEAHEDGVCGLEVLSAPDNGEFSNVTTFLTSESAVESMRFRRGPLGGARGPVSGFVLMSDGPQACLYSKGSMSLAPACGKLMKGCRDAYPGAFDVILSDALGSVVSRRTSDDCSLAIMSRQLMGC